MKYFTAKDHHWPPLFRANVEAAYKILVQGASGGHVAALYGKIVLREARWLRRAVMASAAVEAKSVDRLPPKRELIQEPQRPKNPLEELPKDDSKEWPLPFRKRVRDASKMLMAGVSHNKVMDKHGSIVLRTALEKSL